MRPCAGEMRLRIIRGTGSRMARDTGPVSAGFDNNVGLGSGHLEQNARIALFDNNLFDQAESLGEGLKAARQF